MAANNPQKLRKRVRADIRYMKSHKFCNSRALNYNLFRSYSIPIAEMKQVFKVEFFGDIVRAYMELEGDAEQQRDFAIDTHMEEQATVLPRVDRNRK